jgi:membrane protein implicated in regulation of membrane protease activity
MGHLTLLLTVLYVVVVGIIELPPTYRIVSFLVLAVVLLAVSMVFTRLRAKRKDKERDGAPRNRPEE